MIKVIWNFQILFVWRKKIEALQIKNIDNIPPQIINKIRSNYIKNPDFNPSLIRSVSSACEGLCKWVIAISSYDEIYKVRSKIIFLESPT